ncbi:hypothetical protein DSECCO2_648710 [anaerobic digester metagenome]
MEGDLRTPGKPERLLRRPCRIGNPLARLLVAAANLDPGGFPCVEHASGLVEGDPDPAVHPARGAVHIEQGDVDPGRSIDEHPDLVGERRAGEDLLDGDQRLFAVDDPVFPREHRFAPVDVERPGEFRAGADDAGVGDLPARLYPVAAEDPPDGNIGPHQILPELRCKPPERGAGDRIDEHLSRYAVFQFNDAVVDLVALLDIECRRRLGIGADDVLYQGGDGDRMAGRHLEQAGHRPVGPDENLLHRGEPSHALLDLLYPLDDPVCRQGFHSLG